MPISSESTKDFTFVVRRLKERQEAALWQLLAVALDSHDAKVLSAAYNVESYQRAIDLIREELDDA